jgi:nitroreductase
MTPVLGREDVAAKAETPYDRRTIVTMLDLSVDEVLGTTRAVRRRLDFDRQVEPEVLRQCLELAVQAPSGSNSQNWRWILVTDPEKKRALGDLYRQAFEIYKTIDGNAGNIYSGDDQARVGQQQRVMSSAEFLAQRMGEVPAMLIPCVTTRFDGAPNLQAASIYGSVLPAAWSFMLAARARGLGTSWTTLHLMFEEEAAQVVGIPYADVTQVALIAIGYTKGTEFKPARRGPIDEITGWNGPPPS